MPQTVAFVPGTALPARLASSACLSRRKLARVPAVACARTPDGDDAWMDMAKKLERWRPFGRVFGFGKEPEPGPREPQWVFPEGEDFSTPSKGAGGAETPDEVLDDPWLTWRTALGAAETQGEDGKVQEGRDPKAETDFWRKAAGEVVKGIGSGEVVADAASDAAESGPPGDLAGDEDATIELLPTDPQELWGKASRVTADVADLQESLREEIASFNPLQQSDAYRDIARELVGPSGADRVDGEERGDVEDVDERRGGDDDLGRIREEISAEDAAAGTGWNPDVDWKRYDDINRELQLKADASQRANVQSEAERLRDDALASGGLASPQLSSQSYLDADGRELSDEEVSEALAAGAVIVDEAGNEVMDGKASVGGFEASGVPLPETPFPSAESGASSGVVFNPGAKAARRRGGRTYGADTLDEAEEAAWLEERGFSRRDPEQEKAFWREAAQEIGMALSDDVDVDLEGKPSEVEGGSSISFEDTVEKPAGNDVKEDAEQQQIARIDPNEASTDVVEARPELAPAEEDLNVESSSAWGLWNAGASAWARDVENAPPRDAAAEVDMWRSTANEIVPDASNLRENAETGKEGAAKSSNSSVRDTQGSSAWDDWNSATEQWQADLDKSNATNANVDPADIWRASASSVAEGADDNITAGRGKFASSGVADARSTEKMNWDSGAPSEAWSTWQKSSSSSGSTGLGESTWSTRSDVASNRNSPNTAGNDLSMWASAARELGLGGTTSDGVVSTETSSEIASPVSSASGASDDASTNNIDMWKAAAREVLPPNGTDDADTTDERS